MAGSRRFFGYTTDDGTVLAVDQDESNAESASLGFSSVPGAVAERPELRYKSTSEFPIGLRYILAERNDADGRTVKRKFHVGSTGTGTVWQPQVVVATIGGQTWTITAKVGEVRHYIAFADTGLIDTDVDQNVAAGP